MRRNVFTLALSCLIILLNLNVSGQIPDFTNLYDPAVTCYYGKYENPFEHNGIVNGRHTLITSQGYDPNTGNALPFLPPGENKVIRLGNEITGSDAEAIRYRFTVDHFKSILLLKFAVVFEDPGHPIYEQPRFTVRVTNLNGQLVESCAEYDVTAAGNIPGFNSYGGTRWRPWTNIGIDLSPYIGSEIIVEFITKDCDQSGHFGYAYFTASCIQNNLDIVNCDGTNITLKAPNDFDSYYWSTGNSSQQEQFTVTDESIDAYCDITSTTGCTFRLNAHITREEGLPLQDTVIYDSICAGNSYEINFFNLPIQNQNGDYIFLNTICNIADCSYITITLMLNVSNKVPDVHLYDEICLGDEYNNFGFIEDNLTAGAHTFRNDNITSSGCDSTTVLHLYVNETYDILISEIACEGDGYYDNNFNLDSLEVGIHRDTLYLQTIYGCDSIVKLNLTVGETYYYDIYDSICEGEDYQLYGLNIIQPSEGSYENISNLQTTLGCDSIFNVNLKVINKYNNITIDGLDNILVSTDLVTGCYKYTIDVTEDADQYKWEISNKDWQIYPNNNECLVLATTPAQCTLSVSAGNSCGIASDFIELNAGFIGDQNNSRVTMYPNPVKDFVNIQQVDITRISVYDSYGQLVMRKEYNFDSHVTLDFSSLKSSIYIIEIITLDKTYVERISIVK